MLETDEGSDEKAITAMGLLNTIESLLSVMENRPDIILRLQPTVLQVVAHIFGESVMGKANNNNEGIDTKCNIHFIKMTGNVFFYFRIL